MAFNKVILIGNLVADPELKVTQSGVNVCSFRIGVERRFVNRLADGTSQKVSDFFDIVTWRTTAEFVAKYFVKGKQILICGSLQQRQWEDKEGNKRSTVEVVADEVSFVGPKSDGQGGGNFGAPPSYGSPVGLNIPPSQSGKPLTSTNEFTPKFEEVSGDDDLPF
ncbi:single-stranded DNA-binding protein [Clostridia bacterium]|nr:single-stranded DNA-binding protein [Clostridia bacterium]